MVIIMLEVVGVLVTQQLLGGLEEQVAVVQAVMEESPALQTEQQEQQTLGAVVEQVVDMALMAVLVVQELLSSKNL
jgi:uncharacterized membrane protein YqhA